MESASPKTLSKQNQELPKSEDLSKCKESREESTVSLTEKQASEPGTLRTGEK